MQRVRTGFLSPLVLALVLACGQALAASTLPVFTQASVPEAPDYAETQGWLVQPDTPGVRPVDVFWVYPTVLGDTEHWLMDPASVPLLKAAMNSVLTQAGVFSGQANLYAPIYRQMNMAGLSLPDEQVEKLMQYGMEDVQRAFTYYLEHLNQGRPFILAGHSQGSNLLAEYAVKNWGTLGCENRLVAAYLIGWSITDDDLKANPALKMCGNATQVNCFISYNSVAQGRQKAAPTIRPGAIVTNPLTWTTNDEFAPAALNLGATFFDEDGSTRTYPHFTPAQVKDSGLEVQPEEPGLLDSDSTTFPTGVYHKFDYSLFFENLRQNVHDRIAAYTAQ
ncbi:MULTISPECIES: DUF3089 domain-containing protein [unclassified Pseudodesulfovibrio]|uniref:DUF3089 domain-containing protein n=1 Tax=unclassified Pseudodesulfovibrio TaxID=2661612 RepID=UPI000FEC086C|nr:MULTISPECIES: DUF3089 domain-containing protein [unclassified Pseudodesulfovibrio]MCJ2166109.1 DUF3089 domain-containing protein [Pseudodesulfovibrio sp. S3-i]RWU02403.1 DUF3089 domain-containing protein [Pseudodesulfovibrio sp. S3]